MANKIPLSIYVLYHSKFADGAVIYSQLLENLYGKASDIYTSSINIPVYFCTNDEDGKINDIDFDRSEKTCVIFLIDRHMFLESDDSPWHKFIDSLLDKQNTPNFQIFNVALCASAVKFDTRIGLWQCFNYSADTILSKDQWSSFLLRLYDGLIHFIEPTEPRPLKVFISHSKHDETFTEKQYAIQLRDYLLENQTKLGSFFDACNIYEGLNFPEQLKEAVDKSAMVVLLSDSYSSREWCKKEIILAKLAQRPIVVVSVIKEGLDRMLPYVGNVPYTVVDKGWLSVVLLLLRTVLYQYHQKLYLKNNVENDAGILCAMPEALSFAIKDIKENKGNKIVLYPEPPLGQEELNLLKEIDSEYKFYTPTQYKTKNYNLQERYVRLSISDSEDQRTLGIGKELIDKIVTELLRYILISNGRILFGGILRGYTELIRALSSNYGKYEDNLNGNKQKKCPIYSTDFVAWPYTIDINDEKLEEYKACGVNIIQTEHPNGIDPSKAQHIYESNDIESRLQKVKSVSIMRKKAADFLDMNKRPVLGHIFIGGKLQGSNGPIPGLVEEAILAIEKQHPIFLVGAFGGVTKQLTRIICGDNGFDMIMMNIESNPLQECMLPQIRKSGYFPNLDILKGISFASLHNGLTEEENKILFNSCSVYEIASLIIKGLNTLNNQ